MLYLCVIYVVHLVEDDEFHVSNKVCTLVQHTPQNLSGHNQAASFWINLDISRENAYSSSRKGLLEISELLVRQGLDWGGVYCAVMAD